MSRPASTTVLFATLAVVWSAPAPALGDWFGSGDLRFEIPMVPVGQPGNPADSTEPFGQSAPLPSGVVDYAYRIGKYEVPEEAVRNANALSELAGDPLGITLDERGPQKPATGLSWFEAARFVNWLNADAGFAPAYKFDASGEFRLWQPGDPGYNAANPFRSTLARYALPSADEWHKAAFYDPEAGVWWDYPTGSDDPPTPVAEGTDPGTAVWNQTIGPADVMLSGGESPYGTVGQAGNMNEWEETTADLLNVSAATSRGARGGAFFPSITPVDLSAMFRNQTLPNANPQTVGMRIVSVPEPNTFALLISGGVLPRRRGNA